MTSLSSRRFVLLVCLLVAFVAFSSDVVGGQPPFSGGDDNNGDDNDNNDDSVGHLVGGTDILPDEYKYFVAITTRTGKFRCSGVLIGDRFVATAAHCVESGTDAEFCDVSYYCVRRDNCGRPHEVIAFESFSAKGDFALLTLEKVAFIQPPIEPLVPDYKGKILKRMQPGDEMILVGAGRSNDPNVTGDATTGTALSEFVQELSVEYIPRKTCRKSGFSFALSRGYICSTPTDGIRSGPCQGDSGGPIVVRRGNRDYLVAVHSFGKRVCGAERRKPDGHYSLKAAKKLIRSVVCQGPYPAAWCGRGNSAIAAQTAPPTAAPTPTPTPMQTQTQTRTQSSSSSQSSEFQVYWGVDLGDCLVTLNYLTLECVDPNSTIAVVEVPPQNNPLVCPESTARQLACDFTQDITFSEVSNLIFSCTSSSSTMPSFSSAVKVSLPELRGQCAGFGNTMSQSLIVSPRCVVPENGESRIHFANGDLLTCQDANARSQFTLRAQDIIGCYKSVSCAGFGCSAIVPSLTAMYGAEPFDSRCHEENDDAP